MKKLIPIVAAIIFIGAMLCSFNLGYKVCESSMVKEYRIFLEEEDAEIILETLDEIVSRQEVKE